MSRNDFELAASLIEAEVRDKLAELKTAEDMLAVTFKAAKNHWMFTDDQTQFKGAIGAAMIGLGEGDERDRLTRSFQALSKASAVLAALQAGVPVDLEAMAAERPAKEDVIPLAKMWHAVV